MSKKNLEISQRLISFGQSLFGKERGWKSRFAESMGLSPGGLQLYITGHRRPGFDIQSKLRELGCDIEWLMTGQVHDKLRHRYCILVENKNH